MRYLGYLLLPVLLLLSGCTQTLFISYPSQLQATRRALAAGNYKEAEKNINSVANKQDAVLYTAERARVLQIAGQYKKSLRSFNSAIAMVRHANMAAKVQVSRVLANTASLITNSNIISYQMPGFAQVFLYQYQALNYFALHDPVNALVSIRRADNQQAFVKQQHYKELVAAEKSGAQQNYKYNPKQAAKYFSETQKAAGKIRSSFENAFTYYLSSISYEAIGDLNDAYVSAKNALKVAPNNPAVRLQLLEVLKARGGDNYEFYKYKLLFGVDNKLVEPKTDGKLVVLFSQGLVPEKQQKIIRLPLPIGKHIQIQSIAIPYYRANESHIPVLNLNYLNSSIGQTTVITNVEHMAAKSLLGQYPIIITRTVLRLLTKIALTYKAEEANPWAGLAAQLFTNLTTQADLRSWSTLPRTLQVWQGYLPKGNDHLRLSVAGRMQSFVVNMVPGKITLLWVNLIGSNIKLNSFKL